MNQNKKMNIYAFLSLICIALTGCGQPETSSVVVEELPAQTAGDGIPAQAVTAESAAGTEPENTDSTAQPPSKEKILEMRALCLEGMPEAAARRLCENIKTAHMAMENAFFYDDLFGRLSDKEDPYWNYIDQKGEIIIGYTLEEGQEYEISSGLTYAEYAREYGQPVTAYNRFDAGNFISLMQEMQDSLYTEKLKADFGRLITDMSLAQKTHDVQYVADIYHILHDMDYYLLRYAPEDLGKYVTDPGRILIYYDTLDVYHPERGTENYWMDLQE